MPPRKPVRSNIPPKEETKTIPLNAGTPRKKDPRTNTGNQKSIWRQIADFFGNESMHFILGIIVTLLLVYVTVGMISYFSTGAEDQSKMELSWSELHGVREDIQNITSVSGALLSHNLIHQGFGIASFAIIFFLFIAALRLMQVKFLSVWKTFFNAFFILVWVSISLGFVDIYFKPNIFFSLGGRHGVFVSQWLISYIGELGLLLSLFGILLIYSIIASSKTIPFIRSLFTKKEKENILSKNEDEVEE